MWRIEITSASSSRLAVTVAAPQKDGNGASALLLESPEVPRCATKDLPTSNPDDDSALPSTCASRTSTGRDIGTNPMERTFGGTRRRTEVTGRLPGKRICAALVFGKPDRPQRGWRGITVTPLRSDARKISSVSSSRSIKSQSPMRLMALTDIDHRSLKFTS